MNLQSGSQPLTSGPAGLHRCFYALRFGVEVNAYLATIIEALKQHRADVRWVPSRNIHLTLRFLGELTDAQFEKARTIPAIPRSGDLSLRARGLGAFPLMRAPRVIWAGVEGETRHDTDRLLQLQGMTEEWARRIGLPPENRGYSPHITLGRVARPSPGLHELTNDIISRECQSDYSRIGEIVLMRSVLSGGARYEDVGRYEV